MKVGNDFKVTIPEFDIKEVVNLGGYKLIITKGGEFLIQGIGLFSVNKAKIDSISILPLDEEAQTQIDDFPFEIESHHLIFQVGYTGLAWYFKNRKDAFTLMNIVLKFKENALHNKFIKNIKFQEDEK